MTAQSRATIVPSAVARRLDSLLATSFTPEGPGVAVLISLDGRIVYRGARGLANIAARQPMRLDTPIYVASIAKQFTAAAIMRLAEQGRIRYDDSLGHFLPELGSWSGAVTIAQLLTHTAGIPDYPDAFVDSVPVFDNRVAIDYVKRIGKLDFAPGSKWSYSNAGYVILGQIIERVSGRSLHDFLDAEFFTPLGMHNTSVTDGTHPAPANAARGYSLSNGKYIIAESKSRTTGPGGVHSTVEDLYKWDRAHGEGRLFRESTIREASRPATLTDGRPTPYGFGWLAEFAARGPLANVWYVASTGNLKGFQGLMKRIPDKRYSAIVLTNGGQLPWNIVESAERDFLHPPEDRLPDTVVGPLGRRIHEHLTRTAALGFSGQVVVAVDGKLMLHRSYGFADRRQRVPLRTSTPIGVASASKQFAAAAVLLLEQRGQMSRFDSLSKYFPDAPADKRNLTVHQLLTHTAAIRGGFTEDFESPSADSSVRRLLLEPLTRTPGARWAYSSDAYNIVAAIVAMASKMPYEDFVKRHLMRPADMTTSGFWNDLAGDSARAPQTYVGYMSKGSPAEWPPNYRVFGSGDITSTAADLYRWTRAVSAGAVLAPATLQLYWTPQVKIDSTDSYGYGLFFGTSSRGGRMIEHGGDTELGFNAAVYQYPDRKAALIVLSNARDATGLSARQLVQGDIDRMMFGDTTRPLPAAVTPVKARRLAALHGSYRLPSGAAFHLVSDGAQLWVAAEGAEAIAALSPASGSGTSTLARDSISRRRGTDRTRTLLSGLLARDTSAFFTALMEAGRSRVPEYVRDWREIVVQSGPARRYDIRGCTRLANGAVNCLAKLYFLRSERTFAFTWLEEGEGRLAGLNPAVSPYPVIYPVGAAVGSDSLVVYDPLRLRRIATLRVDNDSRLTVVSNGTARARLLSKPVERLVGY